MTEKKIVIIINSSPFNSLNNYEALRSCMSFFDHETTIIWRKNGETLGGELFKRKYEDKFTPMGAMFNNP